VKILAVHPGASIATHDVHTGLRDALRARGHEVAEYALDARIERSGAWLNYCWRRGGKVVDKPGPADILYHAGEELVARSLRLMPDVVLITSAMYLHPDVLILLKRAGLKTAVLFTESPYDDIRQARLIPYLDCAWTNERYSAEQMGVGYLPHAWHPDIHVPNLPVNPDVPSHDVVFVGTGFQERIDLLGAVDWDGIDLGLYGSWDLMGSRNKLRQYIRGGYVDNPVTIQLYRRAKIGLNLYRTSKGFGRHAPKIDVAYSLNPRAYELARCGCFTISDYRPEVAAVFGDLVPTFTRAEDVRDLVDRWLGDDAGRAHVSAALPATVEDHSWASRAAQVESDLLRAGIGAPRTSPRPATHVAAGA